MGRDRLHRRAFPARPALSPRLRRRAGLALSVLLGLALIGIGATFLLAAPPAADGAVWKRLFSVRDIFLGVVMLLLVALRLRRALGVFLCVAVLLPIGDMLAIADILGWRNAALVNVPFSLPLALAAWLVAGDDAPD